ncbi:MAG: dTDP-glucose 4,6-dehydratase [bacterium]
MNILITGGAGFIGSNFIYHMLERYPGYHIVNLDKLTYAGNLENLKVAEANSRYTFVRGDICDGPLIDSILKQHQVEAVINFAAESHVDRSIMGAAEFVMTNVMGTNTLLERAKLYGVKRYVQISTDEVYGSLGDEGKFTEETPVHPNSPYAASKTSADHLVQAYHHTFGFPVLITRCSNNYGPYQFPEKLIPLMIANAMNDKSLPVYGDGANVRDWIHVSDHCSAIDTVLHKGIVGEVYNIGGKSERKNIEVVKIILQTLGKPDSLITYVKDRPGHDRRYAIDSTKIERELGWTPRYSFEQGMQETIRWYQDHREWWSRIISGEYQEYYKTMYGGREL